jgi:hypothetical protein
MTLHAATVSKIQARLDLLEQAIDAGLNRTRCLRRWSEFIRERDGHRCVNCRSTRNPGNGITLCKPCHQQIH